MAAASPQADYKQEIRFAVVMYGGVSLAIYINGVAQELFRLVRSTAKAGAEGAAGTERAGLSGSPTAPIENSLTSTERVYRKLSHLLSDETLLQQCRQLAEQAKKNEKQDAALQIQLENLVTNDEGVRTGFLVDILSGTSAGGINSIYLAKALANEQRIDRLKQLWISEGDIELLLNDVQSLGGIDLKLQDPPQSLLNSRRMYLKLLRALDDMDRDNARVKDAKSPYAKELDLYITATDIEGVPVPLKLADKVVYERRHRNVFHFKYQEAEKVNDFLAESNPFLAFAARCTSSFPFAFEPMRLSDIDEVLDILPDYRAKPPDESCKSDSPKWNRYFREILDPRTGVPNLRFASRSFGDGGYLDNKPFSYAIEALVRRQSDVPVSRRLIYIEPSPEHPEDVPERDYKPDALTNVKRAVLDLPMHETIREDLQRVLERNLLIERVLRIVSGIEKKVNSKLPKQLETKLDEFIESESAGKTSKPDVYDRDRPMWDQRNITSMIEEEEEEGRSYLSYQSLRVSSVTDQIARLIARLLNFDANSDLLMPLRCLVRVWRGKHYKEDKLKQFLSDFDFSHRIRRLNFIRERIDRLYDYDWRLRQELDEFAEKFGEVGKLLKDVSPDQEVRFRDKHADIGWLLGLLRSSSILSKLDRDPEKKQELREILIFIKCEVNQVYKDMQRQEWELRRRRVQHEESSNPILEPFEKIGIKPEHLNEIIDAENLRTLVQKKFPDRPVPSGGTPNEDDCLLVAEEFLENHVDDKELANRLNDAAKALKEAVQEPITLARHRIGELLKPTTLFTAKSDRGQRYWQKHYNNNPVAWSSSETANCVREYLAYYYYNFDEYDQISFPIFYEADVGEASVVEVIRVSPEDATSLIDEREERRTKADGKGRQKLAGVALHHFGAFLDRSWRQNDIMWGRLDGLERLITALLPGPQNESLREVLIREGHKSILIDELPPEHRLQLGGIVSEALVRTSAGESVEKAITKVTKNAEGESPVKTKLEAAIRASLDNEELLDFIKSGYEVNRQLDPKPLLASISRSTQIIGKVFEDIANSNQLDGKSLAWIARLGQLFWGLVEVAVPNSIRNMLWNHWLYLAYAFEAFIIVAGLLLGSQGAQQFGWTAFGITAVLNIIVLVLRDIMRGRRAVFRATGFFVFMLVFILAALGLLEILGPVFNVRWGQEPGLYPMEWLKEAVKQWIPMSGWLGRNFISLTALVMFAIILVLLNGVFGVVSFSWLDLRLQLCRTWFKKSELRRYFPWGIFKPIRVVADDIDKKTRVFPGKENVYILPFTLSAEPSNEWISFFESKFKAQQDRVRPGQQASINKQEVEVVCSAGELSEAFERLSKAATSANEYYKNLLTERALAEYKSQQDLVAFSRKSPEPDTSSLPDKIRPELEALSAAATKGVSRWTTIGVRALGVLTIVMSLAVLMTLALNQWRMSNHPDLSLPGGMHGPGLAIELVHSPEEVGQIVHTQGTITGESKGDINAVGKNQLRKNIAIDWFVILYYTVTLGLICLWIGIQARKTGGQLALAAFVSLLVAAGADVVENLRILTVLSEDPPLVTTVNSVLAAAMVKWAALFIVLGILGRLLSLRKPAIIKWTGVLMLITMVVGFVGLIRYRVAVEWGFWLMAISLLPLGLRLLIKPKKLAGNSSWSSNH